jgi:hypothetical protein
MNLPDSIVLSIIDKLLIGVLILIFGYWLNERLEKLKGQINLTNAVAPNRAEAYSKLWKITEPLSPNVEEPLDDQQIQKVRQELSSWYYSDGNAMYLSFEASDLFLKSMPLLGDGATSRWDEIKESFSLLRTQLKVDIGTYTRRQARRQLPTRG